MLNQLDPYHVSQALNRTFGGGKNPFKDGVRKAINEHNQDDFKLWVDTFESTRWKKKKPLKSSSHSEHISRTGTEFLIGEKRSRIRLKMREV